MTHDFISREKNSKTKATVQGKLNKLLDAQVILRSAFLKDVLTPAKVFSLITRRKKTQTLLKHLNPSRKQKRTTKNS